MYAYMYAIYIVVYFVQFCKYFVKIFDKVLIGASYKGTLFFDNVKSLSRTFTLIYKDSVYQCQLISLKQISQKKKLKIN